MVEIKQNTMVDTLEEELIERVVKELETSDTSYIYRNGTRISEDIARNVCEAFVRKGYHAKLVYFYGSKGLQSFVISKLKLGDTNARMVYSEMIG